MHRYGPPDIVNTDQGSQFTSVEFIKVLTDRNIRFSMDGKGSWRDNVFVERLWRTVKHMNSKSEMKVSPKEGSQNISIQ